MVKKEVQSGEMVFAISVVEYKCRRCIFLYESKKCYDAHCSAKDRADKQNVFL